MPEYHKRRPGEPQRAEPATHPFDSVKIPSQAVFRAGILPKPQAFFESEDGQLAFAEWEAQQEHTSE